MVLMSVALAPVMMAQSEMPQGVGHLVGGLKVSIHLWSFYFDASPERAVLIWAIYKKGVCIGL
jgi:hypothetical protein